MSDQTDIFSGSVQVETQPQQNQQQQAPAPEVFADLLKDIRNERGEQKYDSVPKALQGLAHAQNFIPQLQTSIQQKDEEIRQLREQLAKASTVEDVVSRLTAQQTRVEDNQPAASGLDEQAVLGLVQNYLSQTKAQESAQGNILKVQEALTSKFGDKAAEVLETKARELGTTRQELGKLASQNPQLVLALFGTQVPQGVKPTTGSVTIPASYKPPVQELTRPEKSLLSGATSRDQAEFMRKIKERVYAKYDVTP